MTPLNIAIFLYQQAEVLDFSGPFEVFATASRLAQAPSPFRVFLVAEQPGPVHARGGFQVVPEFSFEDHPPIDVLIVSGGVHTDQMNKPEVILWIATIAKQCQLVASVCTGAFLLAKAGVLTTQQVTTHWEDIPQLRVQFKDLDVVEKTRWVDSGRLVTSAGISAGIDMSLHLVARLHSMELAQKTARQMEFDWSSTTAS